MRIRDLLLQPGLSDLEREVHNLMREEGSTDGESLYDIWDYLHMSLTEEECSSFTGDNLEKLRQIVES
jgi:hypothetical protein